MHPEMQIFKSIIEITFIPLIFLGSYKLSEYNLLPALSTTICKIYWLEAFSQMLNISYINQTFHKINFWPHSNLFHSRWITGLVVDISGLFY